MFMKKKSVALLTVSFVFCYSICFAAGPEKTAALDRSIWTEKINDNQSYNKASCYETARFAEVIAETELDNIQHIISFTGIEDINLESVKHWRLKIQQELLDNYQHAAKNGKDCETVSNWQQLSHLLNRATIQPGLMPWYLASGEFYRRYLYEQVRLASLFPRITSEIDVIGSNEITGGEFSDGEFLLTFDDGPSGDDRTENLIELLNKENIRSFFFLLGERVKKQGGKLTDLYQQQCVGSHGFQHKSHQKWEGWETSLNKTSLELAKHFNPPFWFRPPYGQRSVPLLKSLDQKNSKVMLWNIDSQDWNRNLSAKQVTDRVVTLMLLRRKGIILFHDIKNKALSHSMPELIKLQKKAGFIWLDCHHFSL